MSGSIEERVNSLEYRVSILEGKAEIPGHLDEDLENEGSKMEKVPPDIARWILARGKGKRSGFFRDLTLTILRLNEEKYLSKREMLTHSEVMGVGGKKFGEWLDKSFMSQHGPMRGLIRWKDRRSKVRVYSLSELGKEEAKVLFEAQLQK